MAEPVTAPSSGKRDDGPFSTLAVISYLLILQFSFVSFGVFLIVHEKIPVDPTMLTVTGSIITAATAALAAVGGYWLAGALGNKDDRAALRQLAGAGPPPPADPSAPVSQPVPEPKP